MFFVICFGELFINSILAFYCGMSRKVPAKCLYSKNSTIFATLKATHMSNSWFEKLPEACPPEDAKPAKGRFYRIAKGNPADSSDFFSQRKLQPEKVFTGSGVDECIARSISLFYDLSDARKRLVIPKFKHAHIVEVNLEPKDGVMKKTFTGSHFSWWRTTDFNVTQVKTIE